MRPAMRRNRELLPAPFGPVKISAPPAAIEKPTPRNTRRPPRMQAKSWPDSFIATISLTLAFAAPNPTPPLGAQASRPRPPEGWGGAAGERFFPREGLFKTIVHMAEPRRSPYKLTFRRVTGDASHTPAHQAIGQRIQCRRSTGLLACRN